MKENCFKENKILIPADKYGYIFLFLVVLRALSYWIISWWQHPQEPLSSIIMYRVGDYHYFPSIAALSRFDLGKMVVFELKGSGMLSVPLAYIFPHALSYRYFGAFGFILADVLVAIAYYLTFAAILKLLRFPSFLAKSVSALIVTGAVRGLVSKLYLSIVHKPLPYASFWDWRIPRPFVSEVFLLLCLYFILSLLCSQNQIKNMRNWFLFGISVAALLQGDIFSTAMIAICIFSSVLYLLLRYRDLRRYIIKGAAVFLITIFICSIPFLLQRIFENPEFVRRCGVFPIDRKSPFFLPGFKFQLAILFLFAMVLIRLFKLYKREDNNYRIIGVYFLSFACLAAYISLPLFCILIGKGIFLFHFREVFFRILTITFLIFSLYVFDLIVTILSKKFRQFKLNHTSGNGFKKSIIVMVVFFSIFYTIKYSYSFSKNSRHMRYDLPEWASLTDYRNNFVALLNELSKKEYEDCKVIGTFDYQVFSWWLTFKHGHSYLADTFVSTVSDSEIESHLIAFCKIIGMSSQDFQSFFNRRYVNMFWLGLSKYHVTKAYTFAPIWDYNEDLQKVIRETDFLITGLRPLAIPNSEQRRLVNRYNTEGTKDDTRRLDLIVLTNDESLGGFKPPEDTFVLSYRNPTFRVWKRK